jgi:hypothetical protein
MREGICAQLFQRLGLRPKENEKSEGAKANNSAKVIAEEKPYDGLKRLNDFRLRQLSSGWVQGETSSSAEPQTGQKSGEDDASDAPSVMTPQVVAHSQAAALPANEEPSAVAPWPPVSAEMQNNLEAFVKMQFNPAKDVKSKQSET